MLAACLLLAAQLPSAESWPHPLALAPERLQADLRFLASDELGGRETGQPGAAIAGAWFESRFRRLGLQPLGASFRLAFPAAPLDLEPAGTRLSVLGEDGAIRVIEAGDDFLPHPAAPAGVAEGELVFAGYAIRDLARRYDDLGGLDLSGKVALVLRWEPEAELESSRFDGLRLTPAAALAAKVRACQERGAVAVLVAAPPGPAKEADAPGAPYWPAFSPFFQSLERIVERQVDGRELRDGNLTPAKVAEQIFCTLQVSAPLGARVPVAMVSRREAEKLARAGGVNLRQWVRDTDEAGLGDGHPLGFRVRVEVALRAPRVTGWNVAAVLPGADPELSHEFVVVGAHYDHVGRNEDGRIWNGADDNGSGSCALLGIAEALAWGAEPPRRSVVFVAFAGEELGLLGASWLLAGGELPAGRIVAMVNLDMIGRAVARSVHVLGTRSAPGLRELVEECATGLGLRADFENEQFFDRSDQAPFYFQRVPVLFFNTDEHPDYHKPTDTWERVDCDATARIATLAWRTVAELAARPLAPSFADGYNRLAPRFGSRPELRIPFPVGFEDRLDY